MAVEASQMRGSQSTSLFLDFNVKWNFGPLLNGAKISLCDQTPHYVLPAKNVAEVSCSLLVAELWTNLLFTRCSTQRLPCTTNTTLP